VCLLINDNFLIMGFLKFLLILLIIYLLGYLFFRVIFPWLLKRFVKKAAQRMNPDFKQDAEKQKRKQGEINIDYIPENKDKNNDEDIDNGEYIDYEEIK